MASFSVPAAAEGTPSEVADVLEALKLQDGDEGDTKKRQLSPEEKEKQDLWEKEQELLKGKLVEEDSSEVLSWESSEDSNPFGRLHHVAGVDISFVKDDPRHQACAMLAILTFPALKVVHTSWAMVEMQEPYIPGFLAFREVGFLLERLEEVKEQHPELTPQAILVDGNGVLHPRGFGLACHLGVLSGIPCVGVGKKLFHVDGLEKGPLHKEQISQRLLRKGDHFLLTGKSGRVWGSALRTSDAAANPVYVSVGHKLSLNSAIALTTACSLNRVPEPIRQADIQSREVLRTK